MSTLTLNSLIFFMCYLSYSNSEVIEINTRYGRLSGLVGRTWYNGKEYYGFRGIPYAKPPVGELRFKPPVPVEAWDNTLEAHKNKPTCMQFNSNMRLKEPIGISGSEDCLYLSVYTPSLTKRLPVIVFDYHDNFKTGFNGTATYTPEFFVEEDVLVVTVNHRLGVFGYLTTGDDVIPGNNGLRDFILALQWIKENIHIFGGDPTRVTLMGSRGGAALVEVLLYSEKATGLFSGAILQGGTAMLSSLFPENPQEKAFELGNVFGIETNGTETLLKELQKVEVNDIMEKQHSVLHGHSQEEVHQRLVYPFSPVVEPEGPNSIITVLPEESTVINDVPVLAGFNSREGLEYVTTYLADPRLIKNMEEFPFVFPIRQKYRFDKKTKPFERAIKDIKKLYLDSTDLDVHNILQFSEYYGDMMQTYAEYFSIRKLAKDLTSPLYFYLFDFRGALNENSDFVVKKSHIPLGYEGATVIDENCYLFVCSRIKKKYKELKKLVSKQPEFRVIEKTVRMWTNFAKTGNPTPEVDPLLKGFKWLPVDSSSEEISYLHLKKKLTMSTEPFLKRFRFWDHFLAYHNGLNKDGIVKEEVVLIEDVK